MKTFMPKKETTQEKWYVVDAEGKTLGRIASKVASVVRGKNSPTFAPHHDPRNFVVILNADKIKLTGNKWRDKKYYHHTGWPKGLRMATALELHNKKPTKLLEEAVYGMIPHNRLGDSLRKHVKIYAGNEHPHEAQNPQPLEIKL